MQNYICSCYKEHKNWKGSLWKHFCHCSVPLFFLFRRQTELKSCRVQWDTQNITGLFLGWDAHLRRSFFYYGCAVCETNLHFHGSMGLIQHPGTVYLSVLLSRLGAAQQITDWYLKCGYSENVLSSDLLNFFADQAWSCLKSSLMVCCWVIWVVIRFSTCVYIHIFATFYVRWEMKTFQRTVTPHLLIKAGLQVCMSLLCAPSAPALFLYTETIFPMPEPSVYLAPRYCLGSCCGPLSCLSCF